MPFGTTTPGMILPPQVIERFATVAAQDYVLPSAGVRAGMVYWVINRPTVMLASVNTVALTIKANDGSTLDALYNGRAIIMALQDNPTNQSHWEVVDIYTDGFAVLTLGAVSGSAPIGVTYSGQTGRFWRHNAFVTQQCEVTWSAVVTPGTGTGTIVGMPYATHSSSTHAGPVSTQLIDFSAASRTWLVLYAANSDSVLRLQLSGDAVSNVFVDTADFSGGSFSKRITGQVTYRKA